MNRNNKKSDFEKFLNTTGLSKEEIEKEVKIFEMLEEGAKIPHKEIVRRAFDIKPLFFDEEDGRLYWMEVPDIYLETFIVYPKLIRPAKMSDLKELTTFQTYHVDGGDPSNLRPGIDEVLRQIPEEYLEETIAFETFFNFEKVKYDKYLKVHVLFTRLYKGKLPEDIAGQPVRYKGKTYRVLPR